jgi:hypothetical protein
MQFEKLIETIVAEVVIELEKFGFEVGYSNKEKNCSCSCKIEKVNPSNCKTSELGEKYFISIRAEVSEIMAL